MTDRIRVLTVVLDKDYRDDDCEHVINAIKMIKGVRSVEPEVVDMQDHVARMEASDKLGAAVIQTVRDFRAGGVS